LEADLWIGVFFNSLKDLGASVRYETFVTTIAEDRERLSGTGLAVSEQRAVQALPRLREDDLTKRVPHFSLIGIVGTFVGPAIPSRIHREAIE
jgi:hypothetical protein